LQINALNDEALSVNNRQLQVLYDNPWKQIPQGHDATHNRWYRERDATPTVETKPTGITYRGRTLTCPLSSVFT